MTLLKLVLSSLPTYFLFLFVIPFAIANAIEKSQKFSLEPLEREQRYSLGEVE